MKVEIGTPACLPLGMALLQQDGHLIPGLIGVTLQHPPVHLLARTGGSLQATGARADAAYRAAEHFLQFHALPGHIEMEIELAIPMFMGLGSDSLLALSVAHALTILHHLDPADTSTRALASGIQPQHALEIWSFDRGGVLCVPAPTTTESLPPVLSRQEVAHPNKQAWAFVLVLPRVPANTPATWEQDRLAALYRTEAYLDQATWPVVRDLLWPALQHCDLAKFGTALMQIQQFNQIALERSGIAQPFTSQEQAILAMLRDNGAVAWGRSATGLALYGLVEGAEASRIARTAIRQMLGPCGGRVMATIIDNKGARHTVRDTHL